MKVGLVVEPVLTHAWHEAVLGCCGRGGAVVDVGGNYGWFSLFSLALGCRVTVFEPVLGLGLALNPGFATRATVHPLLVHDGPPKNFSIRAMVGENGALKLGNKWVITREVQRRSTRLDDVVDGQDEADVEGYEPQAIRMLTALFALGYSARQIAQPYLTKSRELPTRPWHMAPGPWAAESLRTFPSKTAYHAYHRLRTRPEVVAAARSGGGSAADSVPSAGVWEAAAALVDVTIRADISQYSTNFMFRLDAPNMTGAPKLKLLAEQLVSERHRARPIRATRMDPEAAGFDVTDWPALACKWERSSE
ncbi:hypothetical protein EMIHUDRAFT_205779 [Emiliania huxleyi CCMP1516]|uniref:Methyltransferase FkbM domain-containing protein n=2 Tax=Emiliania huxleyi TaxID=2903 RepID=A0A0D3JQB4_EMIH1|nr:hypothetical protein EMIHUDRAFT_205779 [Emiliania huxleyi CCMP1516]EOD25699.1 hypothetical protein EMIHUDRAFT_205779 [Emiliania huxleyi CCMP1516]|eukprot:XP_005778128.1 hypothetical protein EMIHUDRAFT_205779 [Emiliania huxleyi CCMP1516]